MFAKLLAIALVMATVKGDASAAPSPQVSTTNYIDR